MAVNFIHQMNNAMLALAKEERANPSHKSLYFALFYVWNISRFKNEIFIFRQEIMALSGIRSTATYYKCLRELEQFGLLKYFPSKNIYKGSKIKMKTLQKYRNEEGKIQSLDHHKKSKNGKANSDHHQLRPTGIKIGPGDSYDEPL